MLTLGLPGLIQEDSGFSGSFYIIHCNKCMTYEWVCVGVPPPDWLCKLARQQVSGHESAKNLSYGLDDGSLLITEVLVNVWVWFECRNDSDWLFPLQALAWTVWTVWLEQRKKSSTARARSTKMWWDHQPASSTPHALLLCCVRCANCWRQLSCHYIILQKKSNWGLL